jgi:hypothetical protein
MARIARMPHVYYDRDKKRYFVERRVPPDVQTLVGRVKVKHVFPQSVDHATANDLSFGIVKKWEAEWDRVRPQPKRIPWFDTAAILAEHERLAAASAKVLAVVGAGDIILPTPDEYREIRLRERPELAARADSAKPAEAHEIVSPEDAIADWRRNRETAPGPKAIRNKERALRRFFAWLGGAEDLARVTADDVERFKSYLLAEAEDDPENAAYPYDTIVDLKAVFNALPKSKVPRGNPVDDVKNPPKRQRQERAKFTPAERADMLAKSVGQSPVIRITTLIASHSGAHTAEIVEAHTDDIEVRPDGIALFHIREDNRPVNQRLKTTARRRVVPLHPAIRGEVLSYWDRIVAAHGAGPLFPMARLDKDGRRNTYASLEIMDWLRNVVGIRNGERVIRDFYCWRRTVRSALLDAKVDPDRARYIVGHAPKDIDAKHYLEHEISELADAIGRLTSYLGRTSLAS